KRGLLFTTTAHEEAHGAQAGQRQRRRFRQLAQSDIAIRNIIVPRNIGWIDLKVHTVDYGPSRNIGLISGLKREGIAVETWCRNDIPGSIIIYSAQAIIQCEQNIHASDSITGVPREIKRHLRIERIERGLLARRNGVVHRAERA